MEEQLQEELGMAADSLERSCDGLKAYPVLSAGLFRSWQTFKASKGFPLNAMMVISVGEWLAALGKRLTFPEFYIFEQHCSLPLSFRRLKWLKESLSAMWAAPPPNCSFLK
jgi:hypothetical protein